MSESDIPCGPTIGIRRNDHQNLSDRLVLTPLAQLGCDLKELPANDVDKIQLSRFILAE
jgi:hypothetical protein